MQNAFTNSSLLLLSVKIESRVDKGASGLQSCSVQLGFDEDVVLHDSRTRLYILLRIRVR